MANSMRMAWAIQRSAADVGQPNPFRHMSPVKVNLRALNQLPGHLCRTSRALKLSEFKFWY